MKIISKRINKFIRELLNIDKEKIFIKKRNKLEGLHIRVSAFNKEVFQDTDINRALSYLHNLSYSKDNGYSGNKNWELFRIKRSHLARILTELKERADIKEEISFTKDAQKLKRQKGGARIEQVTGIENRENKARDYLKKAKEYLGRAKREYKESKKNYLKEGLKSKEKWDICVKDSISSIEFSLKLILVLVLGKFPTTHDFQDLRSIAILKEAREKINKRHSGLEDAPIERLFFIPHFWSKSYTYAIYGGDYGESGEIYTETEANFAIKHAEEELFYAEKCFFQDIVIDGKWESWITRIEMVDGNTGKRTKIWNIDDKKKD